MIIAISFIYNKYYILYIKYFYASFHIVIYYIIFIEKNTYYPISQILKTIRIFKNSINLN